MDLFLETSKDVNGLRKGAGGTRKKWLTATGNKN